MEGIRIGKISTINYSAGTVRVVYKDRDDNVTKELPMLSFEYHMPKIDDLVLILHLSNGTEAGVVLGRFWTNKNVPAEGYEGLFRKELGNTQGNCFVRYDENTGELSIESNGDIKIKAAGNITINGATINLN